MPYLESKGTWYSIRGDYSFYWWEDCGEIHPMSFWWYPFHRDNYNQKVCHSENNIIISTLWKLSSLICCNSSPMFLDRTYFENLRCLNQILKMIFSNVNWCNLIENTICKWYKTCPLSVNISKLVIVRALKNYLV